MFIGKGPNLGDSLSYTLSLIFSVLVQFRNNCKMSPFANVRLNSGHINYIVRCLHVFRGKKQRSIFQLFQFRFLLFLLSFSYSATTSFLSLSQAEYSRTDQRKVAQHGCRGIRPTNT